MSQDDVAEDHGISRQRVAVLAKRPGAPVDAQGRFLYPDFNLWNHARVVVARLRRRHPNATPAWLAGEAIKLFAALDGAHGIPWIAAAVASVVYRVRVRERGDGVWQAEEPNGQNLSDIPSEDDETD